MDRVLRRRVTILAVVARLVLRRAPVADPVLVEQTSRLYLSSEGMDTPERRRISETMHATVISWDNRDSWYALMPLGGDQKGGTYHE